VNKGAAVFVQFPCEDPALLHFSGLNGLRNHLRAIIGNPLSSV
jgi:hypothetical protein